MELTRVVAKLAAVATTLAALFTVAGAGLPWV